MDSRTRRLEREWRETGNVEAATRWLYSMHQHGHRSLMQCLMCHGCPSCTPECKHSSVTIPRGIEPCQGKRTAPLSDSVVIGSILKIKSCEILAGWTPKPVQTKPGVVDILGEPVDETRQGVTDKVNASPNTRPMNLGERLGKLNSVGAHDVEARVIAALVHACAGNVFDKATAQVGATQRSLRVVQALRAIDAWALEPCTKTRRKLWEEWRRIATELKRAYSQILPNWVPYSYARQTCVVMVQLLGEDAAYAAIAADLEPYLIGDHDPLLKRVERRHQSGIHSGGESTSTEGAAEVRGQ